MAFASPAPVARRLWLAVAGTLSLALFGAIAPLQAAPALLASTDTADPLTGFGERLHQALPSNLSVTRAPSPNGPAVLSAVLADPEKIGFAQRDGMPALRASGERTSAALEIYGDLPACAVALVRRNAPVRSYADMLAMRRNSEVLRVDIGPADGWTAATMTNLRALDATWGHASIENRGGARALSRILSGETDMLVVMAYGTAIDPTLVSALAEGTIEPAPVFASHLTRLAALHGLPYSESRVGLRTGRLFAAPQDYETLCTTLGVVVNANADRAIAEAVARIAVSGGLTPSGNQWLGAIVRTAASAAERALSEVRRSASALMEPGVAWLERLAITPSSTGPQMRPASNLKDDGR